MKRIIDDDPAPYSKTATAEQEAVACLVDILEKKYVKANIRTLDKVPNIDGDIEMTNLDQIPIGKLTVQVKKLGKIAKSGDLSYQCSSSFLAYCENSILPVLLILVDVPSRKAYWKHISVEVLEELASRIKKESVSVHILPKNCISVIEKEYIDQWNLICDEYRKRLYDFDIIKKELSEANKLITELQKFDTTSIGIDDERIKEIRHFLDYFNSYLEKEFSVVKDVLYRNFWKIGLAYIEYENENIEYILYPIKYSVNDLQIKKVTEKNRIEIRGNAIKFIGYFSENPIKVRPRKYALELIEVDLKKIVDSKVLRISEKFVADEFICAFIDEVNYMLGLEPEKEEYSLDELISGITIFIHLWLDETIYKTNDDSVFPINLDSVLLHNLESDIYTIYSKALVKFTALEKPSRSYTIYSNEFDLVYLQALINYKKENNDLIIKRAYSRKKKIKKQFYWRWEVYSQENLFGNIKLFFDNFPKIYDRFVEIYFPELTAELSFYSEYDVFAIVLNYDERSKPEIDYYYLRTESGEKQNRIKIYQSTGDNDTPIDKNNVYDYYRNGLIIEGQEYKLLGATWTTPDFIYESMPVDFYLRVFIKERLKRYFERRIK